MADYLLDWDDTGADGSATFSSSTGGDDITVTVSTPTNVDGDDFTLNNGVLTSSNVCSETKAIINFDAPVENVSFEIYDVDAGPGWDDKITIVAKDADGNIVPVSFSDLIWHHQVNGNSVEGGGNDNPGVEGSGAPDSVTVTIAGPVVSIEIIHDDGDSANLSGAVKISDIEFDAAPVIDPDGYVDGTSGDDIIDVAYTGDPDGDMVDNNDAILADPNGPYLPDSGDNDDWIRAGAGNDTVYAGDGNDLVMGGTGDDTLYGEDGDDQLCGQDGEDTLIGGAGNDLLEGMNGDDTLYGGSGDDILYGDAGDDRLEGGTGNDTIYGGTGEDFVLAGDGDDTVYGGDGDDVLCGQDGDDTLYGGEGNDLLEGMNDNDTLYGGAGDDRITGDAGDDYIEGGAGADTITGGAGRDTIVGGDDGDTVDGGTTGDDYDTLDLSGQGPLRIVGQTTDADGDSTSGTVEFLDADGNVTGTMTFSEIENLILPENTGPVANDDSASTDEDTPVTINVLGNDTDLEGDDLEIVGTPTALHGTVTVNADGTLVYTPDADYNGDDTITYEITDGNGGTDTATVAVTVAPVNDDPVANDDTASTDEDTPVTIDVLGNDTDVDGDDLEIVGTPTADHGTVTVNADGTLTYTPDDNYFGDDTITYVVGDGNGGTDTGSVAVTVGSVNDGPDAVDDTASTDEDTPVTINVLGNDTDPEGDDLEIVGTPTALHGTVTVNADGTLVYTPDADYNGDDTITYEITDGNGGTDTATVAVTVAPVNDDPVANDDADTTDFETPVTIDVLGNDTDVDGDDLDILGTPTSADGTIVVNADGTITFTPNDGFEGDATINYEITDGNGGTDTAVVIVTVGDDPRDGIVSGTDGDDLIDYDYTGDPDGDLVDHNDEIIAGEGPNDDIIEAGAGNDTILAGEGDDDVYGGTGNDTIDGGVGDDILRGEEGNDTITGGDGSDTVYGGDGDDVIDTSGSDPQPDIGYPGLYPADTDPDDDKDTVYGGAGNDTITTGDDADIIFGGTGNDTIDGGIDDDTIDGGDGNDTIIGGEGNDIIDGGAGDDVIYAGLDPSFPDALNIPDDGSGPFGPDLVPNNGMDLVHGGDGNDTIYGADDDDTLYGDAGNDYIDGGIDDDYIDGGSGDDTLIGGQGDDTMVGGTGNDTFDGGTGADIMSGGDDQDIFSNITAGDVVDGNEGGDDFDTLDLTGSRPDGGTLRVIYDAGNPENGHVDFRDEDGNVTGTMEFTNIENVIPCFTPGSLIATPKGERLVEELREGDKVITRDNGIQEIRWVGEKKLDWKALAANPHLKPVLIRKGSLGNDLPERDMMVSPNHRMLVANDKTSLYFEEREVLAAAKHLVNNQGVHSVDTMGISYLHFMFDNHEVVLSDGSWTESFQPGDYTLQGIGNAQRNEILELFPELATAKGIESYQAARRTLKAHEARLLAK